LGAAALGRRLEAAVDVLHEDVTLVGVQLLHGGLDSIGRLDREQHANHQGKGGVLNRRMDYKTNFILAANGMKGSSLDNFKL
jgi:hypothetical protein